MRWPSASPRPAAICATTSPRASIATKQGRKVFDGIHSHIAGIGRIFFNTPFGQPARTGTQHEDHGFPENEFPFSTATTRRSADRQEGLAVPRRRLATPS